MSNQAPRGEKPNPSPWPVDLDGLQARSLAGEPVDIVQAFHDAVTDEMTDIRTFARFPSQFDGQYRQQMLPGVRRLTAGRLLLDTFDAAVSASPDTETFQWRLGTFMSEPLAGLEYYYSRRPEEIGSSKLGKGVRTARSIKYLIDFCSQQPDLESAAIDVWAGVFNEFYKSSGGIYDSNFSHTMYVAKQLYLRTPQARATPQPVLYSKFAKFEPLLAAKVISKNPLPASMSETENPRLLLTDLELSPTSGLNEDNIARLQQHLLDPEFEVRSPIRLVGQSLNATVNLIHGLTELETETAGGPITAIDSRLQSSGRTEPLGYSDMTQLANLLIPFLRAEKGLELESLDASSLEDYPKAIDRILSFVLTTSAPALDETDKTFIFNAAADCIRLMAFKGVEHKLEQRVLTVGDLVVRYPNLSAREQQILIEQLQQRRSEATVHATYRQLRGYHKNRSRFNQAKPGYGLVS